MNERAYRHQYTRNAVTRSVSLYRARHVSIARAPQRGIAGLLLVILPLWQTVNHPVQCPFYPLVYQGDVGGDTLLSRGSKEHALGVACGAIPQPLALECI